MKEIRATNANIYYVKKEDGTFEPRFEIILIVSEPTYKTDDGGEIVRFRTMETIKFKSGVNGLECLIKDFQEYIEKAKCADAVIQPH